MAHPTDVIPDIIDYAKQSLGVPLFPVHQFVLKLFYGLELDRKSEILVRSPIGVHYIFDERSYLKYLFEEGRCSIGEQDGTPRNSMVLALGRRSFSTTFSALIASYEAFKLLHRFSPQEYYGLPEGNHIQVLAVGEDKDASSSIHREFMNHISRNKWNRVELEGNVASNTLYTVKFKTGYDVEHQKLPSVAFRAKAANAKGLKGRGNIAVILSGMARYPNAKEMYLATVPSTTAFFQKDSEGRRIGNFDGRIVLVSVPAGKSGQFYQCFNGIMQTKELSQSSIALRIPSWEANPMLRMSDDLLEELRRCDPDLFRTEFGAEFAEPTPAEAYMQRNSA